MNNQEVPASNNPEQQTPPEKIDRGLVNAETNSEFLEAKESRPIVDGSNQNKSKPINLPSVDLSNVVAATQASQSDGNDQDTPIVADDVDVIEKEWVDKAKSIIQAYRNDPHLQEREINKLQQSYLGKRYGKKITKLDE